MEGAGVVGQELGQWAGRVAGHVLDCRVDLPPVCARHCGLHGRKVGGVRLGDAFCGQPGGHLGHWQVHVADLAPEHGRHLGSDLCVRERLRAGEQVILGLAYRAGQQGGGHVTDVPGVDVVHPGFPPGTVEAISSQVPDEVLHEAGRLQDGVRHAGRPQVLIDLPVHAAAERIAGLGATDRHRDDLCHAGHFGQVDDGGEGLGEAGEGHAVKEQPVAGRQMGGDRLRLGEVAQRMLDPQAGGLAHDRQHVLASYPFDEGPADGAGAACYHDHYGLLEVESQIPVTSDDILNGIRPSTYRERRVRADAKRNLDKIVEAAAEVVAERGVSAPMEAIAKRAGVGVGTLYRRFPDRAALIAALSRHYVTSVNKAVEAAVTSASDAWSAIRDFVDWVAEPGRGALAAALAELPEETLADMEEFEEDQRRWVQQLDELVRRAQADGMMRPDVSAEDIIHLLNVFTCHPDALPAPVAAQPTKYLHLVLDGMQAAMATPLPAPHG